MRKKMLALVLAVSMILGLTACGGAPASSAETAPAETETEAGTGDKEAEEAPAEKEAAVNVDTTAAASNNAWKMAKAPAEYKICCYWPAPDTFFDSYVLEGLEAFETDYGVDIEWVVGTEWTQDVENQMVEAKAAEGYDLFLIFGADTAGANALYSELYDAGCQVINYAGLMDDPQKSASTLASDVYVQAYNSAKNLIELMGGEGKMINVLEQLSDVNTQKRQKGVEDAAAEYENVTIVQTVADIATVDEGYEKISDALTANEGVTGIITTGGTASQGLANALSDYYGTNPDAVHIFAGSMDQSNEVMDAIENGVIDYTIAQNGWAMGYVSSLILCMLEDGWEANEFGQFIDTGYFFISKENSETWQKDIEEKAGELISTLETDWFQAAQ